MVIGRVMMFQSLFIINTMLKSVSTTLIILSIIVLTQSRNLNRQSLLRRLPQKFLNAELVSTPKNLLLRLTSGDQVKLLTVPDVYQFYNYSSGHSCLQGIFSYYQFPTDAIRYRQDMFISPTDFDNNKFSSPEKIIEAAQRLLSKQTVPNRQNVFQLKIQQNLTHKDIEQLIQKGVPPILLITKNRSNEYGSYVIVIGHDKENYYIQDPFKMGSIAYLPKDQLDAHWHSRLADRQASHLAIVIEYKDGRKTPEVPLVRPSP